MTDIDIPALIERLRDLDDDHVIGAGLTVGDVRQLIALAVSPLPEEIAGIIDRLHHQHFPGLGVVEALLMADAAAALERMARAYEVLKNDCAECFAQNEQYAARIRELEAVAKCDSCGKPFDENGGICEPCHSSAIGAHMKPVVTARDDYWQAWKAAMAERDSLSAKLHKYFGELKIDADAIKAKTIADCLSVIPGGNICDPQKIADSIRAFMPAGDEKEK